MRKVRFSEVQMVAILHDAQSMPVADVARKHKISGQVTGVGAVCVVQLLGCE